MLRLSFLKMMVAAKNVTILSKMYICNGQCIIFMLICAVIRLIRCKHLVRTVQNQQQKSVFPGVIIGQKPLILKDRSNLRRNETKTVSIQARYLFFPTRDIFFLAGKLSARLATAHNT